MNGRVSVISVMLIIHDREHVLLCFLFTLFTSLHFAIPIPKSLSIIPIDVVLVVHILTVQKLV